MKLQWKERFNNGGICDFRKMYDFYFKWLLSKTCACFYIKNLPETMDEFFVKSTLIVDGEKVVKDSAGWGLQPRTVVGQCKNGVVLFLVADGRQPGYSLGATMEDCADVLLQYGAVSAAACDGGSSSVMAYNGEIINKPSTDMPTGRYLPNAWIVERKTPADNEE